MQEHIDACLDLEKNLPVELAFLIRQQAYCMARMNQLDRKIRKLQETSQVVQSQPKQHQTVDPTTTHVSSTSTALNQRLHGHHHHHYLQQSQQQQHQLNQQTFNAQGQAIATTTKNGNFILSDDSGGEYSRATISDDDELSSLLDQIAKSIRPDQSRVGNGSSSSVNMISNNNISQSMPQPHHNHQQSPLNQIQHRQHHMATTNYGAFQGNQQQQQSQQQYAIINPSQMHPHPHSHHHQALPIFVMGSPIVPVATHPSSISSNVLPGVHFQPEPRYNQYYEDFYCNGPSVAQVNASVPQAIPSAVTMMMPNRQQQQSFAATTPHHHHHHHHQQQKLPSQLQQIHNLRASQQQHFESSMSAIEQIVTQKEKRQIMSQLKTADNWLKMRSSANTSNSASNQRHNESSFSSGSNNNNNTSNKSGNAEASSSTTSGGSVLATASIVAPTAPRELTDLAQQTLTSDKTTTNNTRLLSTAIEQITSGSAESTAMAISDEKR